MMYIDLVLDYADISNIFMKAPCNSAKTICHVKGQNDKNCTINFLFS